MTEEWTVEYSLADKMVDALVHQTGEYARLPCSLVNSIALLDLENDEVFIIDIRKAILEVK